MKDWVINTAQDTGIFLRFEIASLSFLLKNFPQQKKPLQFLTSPKPSFLTLFFLCFLLCGPHSQAGKPEQAFGRMEHLWQGTEDLSFVFCGQEQKAQHFLPCTMCFSWLYDRCANVSGFHHFSAAVLISRKGCPGHQTEAFLCCI